VFLLISITLTVSFKEQIKLEDWETEYTGRSLIFDGGCDTVVTVLTIIKVVILSLGRLDQYTNTVTIDWCTVWESHF